MKLTTDFLYNRLPPHYRNVDAKYNYPLKRFLSVLVEGGFNPVERDIERMYDLLDPDKCPAEFLPLLAAILGFEFPFDMPEDIQRRFIKNAAKLYRIKGTRASLQYLISELMGFQAILTSEDVINKTFVVDITASGDDPHLELKQKKIVQLLEMYKPVGSRFSILTGYGFEDRAPFFIAEEERVEAIRTRLNTIGGFRLNTKGEWLNVKDVVYEV